MEKYFTQKWYLSILFFMILMITSQKAYSQVPPGPDYGSVTPTTVKTPKGENVQGLIYTDIAEWISYWESLGILYINEFNWHANRIAPATHQYNCYGYAFHVSEGNSNVWLNERSQYWTGNQSYISTTNWNIGRKIDFRSAGHAAITTNDPAKVRSKWGKLPLYEHNTLECPYEIDSIVYYELNPAMNGNIDFLCNNIQ